MILTSPLLSRFDWLEHGFGTRLFVPAQDRMASLKQVHSATVLVAQQHSGCTGEGDALISGAPGTFVSVRTADCFPVLMADAKTRAVAAVHAGWRGTLAEIVIRAAERMRAEFGTDPKNIFAAIGPGIGACCYFVGEDVARRTAGKAASPLEKRSRVESQATISRDSERNWRRQLCGAGVSFFPPG